MILLQNLLGRMTLSHNQEEHSLDGGVAGQGGVWSVQAALWAMWGNISVTSLCSQQVLHLHPESNFNLNTPSRVSSACVSVCNMALHLADMVRNLNTFFISTKHFFVHAECMIIQDNCKKCRLKLVN